MMSLSLSTRKKSEVFTGVRERDGNGVRGRPVAPEIACKQEFKRHSFVSFLVGIAKSDTLDRLKGARNTTRCIGGRIGVVATQEERS